MSANTPRLLFLPLVLSLPSVLVRAQEVPPPLPTPAAAPRTAMALQQDFVAIAKNVLPSVVTVRTFVRGEVAGAKAASGPIAPVIEDSGWVAAPTIERDYPGFLPHGSGSGFFVGAGGEVLTCLQPLMVGPDRQVDLVEVETMDGHRVLCDVVGTEPTLQLAVLRCAVFPSWAKPDMKPLSFGDSDALEIGSWVLGYGDPFGPERYIGTGLLVAKPSRDCYQELMNATYMQATMLMHPGAYGGPMVDLDGKVVGILTKLTFTGTTSLEGLGSAWALPSKILSGLYESMLAAGTTQSPWLGFSVMSRAELATARGLPAFQAMKKPRHGILLENVFRPSPALAAGLAPEDFLTHFDGHEIQAPIDFQRHLYLAGVGRKVTLQFFRAGETFTKELVIEKRPAEAKPR